MITKKITHINTGSQDNILNLVIKLTPPVIIMKGNTPIERKLNMVLDWEIGETACF